MQNSTTTARKAAATPRPAPTQEHEPTVTERAAAAAHRVVDQVAEKASGAEEHLRERASRTSDQVESSTEEIKARAQDGLASAEKYARENPLAAAGIAFAAGVLASVLLRR